MSIRAALLILTLSVIVSAPLVAQDARGTMLGRATDSSGAVVPGAEVRALNVATGVAAVAKTNTAGNYVLPYLLPGRYTLSAELAGFKRFTREGVQVRIADSVEVNIAMEVGDVAESIEVRAETPLLSTTEASLGQVIDERRVLELPLFAGNPMDLVHLAPGITNTTNLRLRKAGWNAAPSQFSTDGAGSNRNEFTIDGVSNTYSDGTAPRVAFSPPATAVQEFRVQTSSFDAAVGYTGGGTVNLSTKSGTNRVHGEAHWWLRHSALDTPNIFQNRAGQSLPVYRDNRYGASAGGPVVLPRLYDGRNRTFWFYAWEANQWGVPQSFTATVPTAAMRRGDLSDLLAIGSNYQIYDPATIARAPGGRFSRQPFSGNVIPTSRLDPVGQKLLALYPLPNQPGTRDQRNNYFRTGNALEDYWVHMGRVDHTFSENHRLFLRFHRDFWEEDKNRTFADNTNGIILTRNNRGIALDDVYVFNPTFLLNVRYGITQQDFPQERVSRGFDVASLGFSPNLVRLVQAERATLPRVQAGSLTQLSTWEGPGDGVTSSVIHSLVANFTKLKGDHNLRFGNEFRAYREFQNRFPTEVSPYFVFSNAWARGPLDNSPAPPVGAELAALLLGIPGGSMTRSGSAAEQNLHNALYLQDDFKVSRRLTLNLGLRWEYEGPLTERFDRSVAGFAFDTSSPIEAQARANYAANPIPELSPDQFRVLGGLTFANTGGNARTLWKGEKNNLMPRIGLAYQLHNTTVLRAGYGMFYSPIGILYTNTIPTGFSQSTPIQASLDSGLSFIASTANPFPSGLLPPLGAAGGLETNLGQSVSFFRSERKNPYNQKWSFGVQHQLPQQWLLDVSYVGSRTTRLNLNRNLNFTPAEYLSTLPYRDQDTINFLTRSFPNPFRGTNPIYGANISRAALLEPYPHFGAVTAVSDPIGYSWYHALQTRLERRFAQGYTFQLSYTWSKTMEAVEFLNASDPAPYRSLAALDRPHRLVMSGIYELPFGRGRRFGSSWHPALNFIAGGWQLNGVMQRQSGPALEFGNIIFNGNIQDIALPKNERSVDRWFNIDAGFNRNSAQQLASNIRTFPLRFGGIRADGQSRWDFSAIKNFHITEGVRMQFRAETFNAWNHPNLNAPQMSPTNSAFGRITGQDQTRSWQFALKLDF
ncbi:MAG: carboxypeptidase regulatory-like domain-containing protein [Acidobacteria bacterium]|nr:carboxypeptidase regulatory-like domain-containing protein [Acidobacteriota bacterium]